MTRQVMTATIWRHIRDDQQPDNSEGDTDAWDEIDHEFMALVAHALDNVGCDVKVQDLWYTEEEDAGE